MTIKIELPASHTVTKGPRDKSWNAAVTVDLGTLSADIVARLAVHGLHQKIADAASGATNETEALAAMQKAADAIVAGEWSSRVAGSGGVDEFTRVARIIVRAAFKAANAANSAPRVAFKALDADEQNAKLDEWFAANEDAMRPAVEEELAKRAAAAKSKAGLARAVAFNL